MPSKMPTAAKLVASIFFAALGWFVADLTKPYLPEGRSFEWLSPGLAAVGLLVGWRFTGKRIGSGMGGAVGIGLSTGFLLWFLGLFSFSGYEMLRLSLRKSYDGPVEAIRAVVEIGLEFGLMLSQPDVIGTLVVGSLLGGWLTQRTARKWS
ncbi:TrgA family protein [Aliiroseovarius lamellibrachiae]|mgnify:CR=1 FL=1|uniref:TrgA family protein n=1 Tax=Aliiroseovarius lamellibrachiae TaxID=1924933 RepID=UPI001BDFC361|nr:TrgA family protein [Aliiroseovarius lamellibrachiae]MBT2131015.1 TrgA family protein [Aliiroseovarius lamellibrachiae]